jgi:hypothetical protein
MEHLVDGEAQDVAVDCGEALQFVVLGVLAEFYVDTRGVFEQAANQAFTESACRRAKTPECVEILEIRDAGAASLIALVEKLDGCLAAFTSYAHDNLV